MPFIFDREKQQRERYAFEWGGGTFYFRRLTQMDRAQAYKAATKAGATNWMEFSMRLVQRALVGWDDVVDGTGAPLPFNIKLLDHFPDDFVNEFLEQYNTLFTPEDGQVEADLKNSMISSTVLEP